MSSAIPAAITALVTALRAAPALAGVIVFDGPPMTDADAPEWIGVGYDPATDEAVSFDREWAGLGALRQDEAFTILCTLASSLGDEPILARRLRAFALLDAVSAVLSADPTLGGVCQQGASVHGSGALTQSEDGQGAAAGIRFRVECQTRISS